MQLHSSDRARLAADLPEVRSAASGKENAAPSAMAYIEAWMRRMAAKRCDCDKPSPSGGAAAKHWSVPATARRLLAVHWDGIDDDNDKELPKHEHECDACKHVSGDGNDSDASPVCECGEEHPVAETKEAKAAKAGAAKAAK